MNHMQQEHNHHQFQNQQQQRLQELLPTILPNHFASMLPYLNLNIQMLAAHQQALVAAQLSPNHFNNNNVCDDMEDYDEDINVLSSTNDRNLHDLPNPESPSSSVPNTSLNRTNDDSMVIDEPNQPHQSECKSTNLVKHNANTDKHTSMDASNSTSRPESSSTSAAAKIQECKSCGILFRDAVLYTIHMGYHGFNDVFKCNNCGEKCDDHISFFLHIAKKEHP